MKTHTVSKRLLVGIWLALLILLALTYGLAQMDMGHFNAAAAFTIALLKMVLVILFFMHVKYKPPLTWIFVSAGFIWFLIMVDLTLTDYMSRGAVPGYPDKTWQHGAWPSPTKERPAPARQ